MPYIAWRYNRRAIVRRLDLLQKQLGLRFRHDIQLTFQCFAADLMLPECLRPLAARRIKPHQHAMAFFAHRIDFQHPLYRRDRAFAVLSVRQLCQNIDGEVMESRALDLQPGGKASIRRDVPIHQVPAVERRRLLHVPRSSETLEFDHVDHRDRRIKADRLAVGLERAGLP